MRISAFLLSTLLLAQVASANAGAYPYDAGRWAAGDSAVYDVHSRGVRMGTLVRVIKRVTTDTVTLRGVLKYDPIYMLEDLITETVYDRKTSDLVSVTVNDRELEIGQWEFGKGRDEVVDVPAGEFKVRKYDAVDYSNQSSQMWINAAETCLDGVVKMKRDVGIHSFTFRLRRFRCTAHP